MSTSIVTAPVLIPSADVDVRTMTRIELGRHGEDLAAAHLDALGWTLLERNHRIARGEIDIIALDGETLVFVEVKARRTLLTGLPQAAVDPRKVRRLRHLVGYYLLDNAPPHRDVRIDVAAVLFADDGTARLELLRAVGA
ncbi:YraN family protein [Brachybacterium nesterenkovii]|uniref:YraN family protein n=1 Tax=Brachybacterium nesterenkovii TaxID=47847 RepID=UPI00321BFD3C